IANRPRSELDTAKTCALGWSPARSLEDYIRDFRAVHARGTPHEKRILVFTTTFFPTVGPAEEALLGLIREIPDMHFDIVTAAFSPEGRECASPVENATIHCVGIGRPIDKYLLPLLGFFRARSLQRKYRYLFAWSVMASYGALGALVLRRISRLPLLITLADQDIRNVSPAIRFLLRAILTDADQVYGMTAAQEEDAAVLSRSALRRSIGEGDAFANQIRYAYAQMLDRLSREQSTAMPDNLKCGVSVDGRPMHYSVGAIIKRDGGFLLFDRVRPPYGFAGPAGHVEEGEEPHDAVVREVSEETGLKVLSSTFLFDEELADDTCRHGVHVHRWRLYECQVEGELLPAADEARGMGYFIPDANWPDAIEPNWRHWFARLGIGNDESPYNGQYGIVLLPDHETARAVESRSAAFGGNHIHLGASHAPHLTLYHTSVRNAPDEFVSGLLERIAQELPYAATLDRIRGFGGHFIFWDATMTPELRSMHETALALASYFDAQVESQTAREGLRLTEAEAANVARFGHPAVGELWRPHVTLGYLETEPADVYPTHAAQARFDRVAFVEIGEWGTIRNVVKCVPVQD
ncbi:MAG TPA: NUDIX domain-containing protein, partial [Candidatus Paceibacterota bacterium]|nr:NUDIX domain-containing protein [Candidatus Paceibacterota bacterium]